MTINVFDVEIDAWANQIDGPVAVELMMVANERVLPDARQSMGVDATYTRGGPNNAWYVWSANPSPGPPRKRTANMVNNLEISVPMHDEKGLVVYGTSQAIHYGRNYWQILRDERGYRAFVNNPYYTYDGIPS